MNIGDRISQLRGMLSRKAFSERLGVSLNTIVRYEKGEGQPDAAFIASLCESYGVTPNWLIFGNNDNASQPLEATDIVSIPKVDAVLSAGGGSFMDSKQVVGDFSFKKEWFNRLGRLKDLVAMDVMGDSMEPTISNRDTVVINLANTNPLLGKVFAVAFDGLIYLKRVFTEPGKLILRSDNTVHSDITIDLDDESQREAVEVIGQAVWWTHDET